MRITRIILAAAAALALTACAAKQGLSDTDKARAEALYQANCTSCHDATGSGAPSRAALQSRKPAAILAALETGLMREQGKAMQGEERRLLADYLGARSGPVAGKMCQGSLELAGAPLWNRWGNGVENRRFQPAAPGGITPDTVGELELKWAFAFPDAARARSQPAVTAEAIFTGSPDGRVYALDRATGCIWWTFDADGEVRSAPTLGTDSVGRIDRIYFGDFHANVYALDARSGKLVCNRLADAARRTALRAAVIDRSGERDGGRLSVLHLPRRGDRA
jgi:polyvinyl alcohol dehydrogenase (cytochrome)